MMTCESCPPCPVPIKRSRNVQVDSHRHSNRQDEDVPGNVCPPRLESCSGCSSHPRQRKPGPAQPSSLSLSLGRQLKRQLLQPAGCRHRVHSPAGGLVMTQPCDARSGAVGGVRTPIDGVDCHELAALLGVKDDLLVIDSRSFMDYNTSHIRCAVNVANSKIGKRRLQHERVSVRDLLVNNCDADSYSWAVVYDTNTRTVGQIASDSFQAILLEKLTAIFPRVSFLNGGFNEFQTRYPTQIEDKQRPCAPLASTLSQPCMPTTNAGLTRILPFLYLGSQQDAQNKQLLWGHNITYVLNVSATCPKADFIPEMQFLRISVNDNYSEKLMPHFAKASNFIERARESGGCVLVHCLAGVSRSPTIAIAFVMKHLRMSSDDAYRYVKSKRPTISPNFNFLGQLLEYEKQLRREKVLEASADLCSSAPALSPSSPLSPATLSPSRERDFPAVCQKKQRLSPRTVMLPRQLTLALKRPMETVQASPPEGNSPASGAVSPTTGIARLNFGGSQENLAVPEPTRPLEGVPRSLSCNLEWLGTHEDENLPPAEVERNLTMSPGAERPVDLLPGFVLSREPQTPQIGTDLPTASGSGKGRSKDHHHQPPTLCRSLCKTLSAASLRRHLRRSDSVSTNATSGYGSQISDFPDTLEDDVLSDSDESVVLRGSGVSGQGSWSGGDRGHGRVSRHDSAYRSMTFDEGTFSGSREGRDREPSRCKPLDSPLSPSEQHLIIDFEPDETLREVESPEPQTSVEGRLPEGWSCGDRSQQRQQQTQHLHQQTDFESSHDSGYVTSVSSTSSTSLTSSMRSSIMSSSTSSSCARRSTMVDWQRSQCSSTSHQGDLESSQESGIVATASSMTSSICSTRSSSLMSSSMYSSCSRYRESFGAAGTIGSIDVLNVAGGNSCQSKLSQHTRRAISQLSRLVGASRSRTSTDRVRQMALPRTRSLPGLESLKNLDSTPGAGSGRENLQARNRHSYSGAIDLNFEGSASPTTARLGIAVN